MAESIVSCPECDKKFRIRDASTPGQFECSACQAVVSYGAPAAPPARPARARPAAGRGAARGGPRGGGRGGPGRARGGSRGRRGGGRYGDEEGGPPPKSNAALYAILGVGGAVVVIGIVLAIVLSSGGDPVTPVAGIGDGVTNNSGSGGGTDVNEPARTSPLDTGDPAPLGGTPGETGPTVPTATGGIGEVNQPDPGQPTPGGSARETARPDRSIGDAGVSEGGFYGKKRTNLRTLSYEKLAKDLDHFDDTPADQQAEIDKLCATVVDFFAGRDGLIAQDRLAEIGRASLPKVISSFLKVGDPGTREGMINACMVDGTLRRIAGSPKRVYPAMTPMANPNKDLIRKTAKAWYVWFYSEGYAIKTFDLGEEDEEEEEE